MYLITKGKIICMDGGFVISKYEYYDKETEKRSPTIVSWPLSNRKDVSKLAVYMDSSDMDKAFDSLVNFLKTRNDVFEL